MKNKLDILVNIIIVVLLLLASVSHHGKVFGSKWKDVFSPATKEQVFNKPTQKQLAEMGYSHTTLVELEKGIWEIESSRKEKIGKVLASLKFSKNVYGFAGEVPLFIYLDQKNTIQQIQILNNNETPEFLESVKDKNIHTQWIGQNIKTFESFQADSVTGATMTSNAINTSVKQSIMGIHNGHFNQKSWFEHWNYKTILALLVVIYGFFMSFYASKHKKLRTLQLLLNVSVLGIWCGKFISLNALQSFVSNGATLSSNSFLILTLILVVIIPLFFKKKAFYCTWICPLGSAQSLLGKVKKRKVKIPKRIMKYLKHSQMFITMTVFFLMWLGIATHIVDYELFSVFMIQHASWIVIAIAGLSLITSIFITRPWCRFGCPTGQVLSWIERS